MIAGDSYVLIAVKLMVLAAASRLLMAFSSSVAFGSITGAGFAAAPELGGQPEIRCSCCACEPALMAKPEIASDASLNLLERPIVRP